MTFAEVCSVLCVEHGVSLEAVWRLTRSQIRAVYFRERDGEGRLVRPPEPTSAAADPMRDLRRLRGWPEWRIEEAAGRE